MTCRQEFPVTGQAPEPATQTHTHTHMEKKTQKNKQGKKPLRGFFAYLSRVSGLESTPDKYGGECDDVPGFTFTTDLFIFNGNV